VNSYSTYEESVTNAAAFGTTDYEIYGITDTGSSCLSLPTDLYNFVISYLLNYLSYYEYDYYYGWGYLYYCSDISSLPAIDLLWGGYWLEIFVDDYIVNFDDYTCAFCITELSPDIAILGDSFLRNFYVIHDYDNMQISFAPLANSDVTKANPIAGTVPDTSFYDYECTDCNNN